MSTTVAGKMLVILGASTGKFDSAMAKSGKRVDGLAGKINVASAAVLKFGAALGTAAIARQLKNMVVEQMNAIDKVAKLSTELGIATEDILKFSHAAKLTGVSQETLNKGLQILVRRLGEAKAGWGEGAKGMQLLGLSAAELAGKTTAEAMKDIAEAISRIPDQATKAAAAYSLFGRQGVDLLNFLQSGRGGLEAMGDELERLGGLFNNLQGKQVEAAVDELTRVEKALDGLKTRLTIELAPAIETIAGLATDALVGMNTEIERAGEKFGGLADKVLAVADGLVMVVRINDAINKTIDFALDNAGGIASRGNKFQKTGAKTKEHFSGIADDLLAELPSQQAARVAAQRAADAENAKKKQDNALPNLAGPALAIGRDYAGVAGNIFGEISKRFEGLGPVLGNVKDRFAGLAETLREDMKRGREVAEEFQTAGERFAKTKADLDRLLGMKAIDQKTHGRGMAAAQKELADSMGLDITKRLTSGEKYAAALDKIDEMAQSGKFSPDQIQAALQNAKADFGGDQVYEGPNVAGLAERGSQAAYDAIVRAMGGGQDSQELAELKQIKALMQSNNMRFAELNSRLDLQLAETH